MLKVLVMLDQLTGTPREGWPAYQHMLLQVKQHCMRILGATKLCGPLTFPLHVGSNAELRVSCQTLTWLKPWQLPMAKPMP